jgi:hypothetical protein
VGANSLAADRAVDHGLEISTEMGPTHFLVRGAGIGRAADVLVDLLDRRGHRLGRVPLRLRDPPKIRARFG